MTKYLCGSYCMIHYKNRYDGRDFIGRDKCLMISKYGEKNKKAQIFWAHDPLSGGGSRISGKGVHMYKGVWGFTLLILSNFS